MGRWWQSVLRPFRGIRSVNQLYSLAGARTEALRQWDRQDALRKQLIVFVHGFNSSKDQAWGQFPKLLMDDPEFADFNVHRFGYPTEIVGQVTDIQDEGQLLASFLKETLPDYRSTVLVGHSMGGLVILHALLSLEAQALSIIVNADLKVLTFATPYLGVENAGVLQFLLNNQQARNMAVLSKELSRLLWDWKYRFNHSGAPGERVTPQVPLYAYYGIEDDFVRQASACGGPAASCEAVDGDHDSIVKPINREHLAYKKLQVKVLGSVPKTRPTPQEKIGIWVARIDGDQATQAQRSLIQSLEFHLHREPEMAEVVEVRELPATVAGDTLRERKADAERLGTRHNAAIVVWGHVTRLLEHVEFHPRVTLIAGKYSKAKTSVLPALTEAPRQQTELTPGTIDLAPEPLKEPLQLARFVLASSFFFRDEWNKAANQFEILLADAGGSALIQTELSLFASMAHMRVYRNTKDKSALAKAKERGPDPLDVGREYHSPEIFMETCSHLLSIERDMVDEGLLPAADLQNEVAVYFQELVPTFKEPADADLLSKGTHYLHSYCRFLLFLASAYNTLAEKGMDPVPNLKRALQAAKEASEHTDEASDPELFATAHEVLAESYQSLADQGVEVYENITSFVDAMQAMSRVSNRLKDWKRGAWARIKLGMLHEKLADSCTEHVPRMHLEEAQKAYDEALQAARENQDRTAETALSNLLENLRKSLDKLTASERST